MDLRKVFRPRPPAASLEQRLSAYREVLQANNAALGFLAGIQEALQSDRPLSNAELRRLLTGVTVQTYRMICTLDRMTGGKQKVVRQRFDVLRRRISAGAVPTPVLSPVPLTIPLQEVGAALVEQVGQKSAYLGEARRLFPEHLPPGFATSVQAYQAFMAAGDLAGRIAEITQGLEVEQLASCFAASARAVQLLETAPVPEEVAAALRDGVAALRGGPSLRLAVRSSALQEGGLEVSFAGQYRSLLNVAADEVVDAFRRVVASKYSPPALIYRLSRGYQDAEIGMCCCVMQMVEARAAGVLYSSYPSPKGPRTVVQAVHGLGLSAVDGSVRPVSFLLERGHSTQAAARTAPREPRSAGAVVEVQPGLQPHQLCCASGEGTLRLPVPEAEQRRPAITHEQALSLAQKAWRLEEALGHPLDLEWAIDQQGREWLLQVRPLADAPAAAPAARAIRPAGVRALLENGSRASGGVGCGPCFRVETDLDLLCCPAGAVAVLREANPRYAVILPRLAAVVADFGELTGHLATVARELRVPAIFGTGRATELLTDAQLVTVDADAGAVYAGRVEALLDRPEAAGSGAVRPPDVNRERLQELSPLIVPLTLRDRISSGYSPRACKTLHDLIRYCHQATIEALFDLGDQALRGEGRPRRLISPVPIDCRIIDLGGGLRADCDSPEVELTAVSCRPLLALWRGMIDPRLRWQQQRPVSLRGLVSALVNYNFDDDARMRRMGDPSFAFVSADYLNLNSRIGYHFATVDARLGELPESNYASFRFAGGSTGIDQRSRRAELIRRLLSARGFETDSRADLVNARLRHCPAEQLEEALVTVGLLIGFVNHLDMALTSDQILRRYEEAFLAGDYGFGRSEHGD